MRKKRSFASKRRKRTSLRPAPFLWIFLIVNIAIGLEFSKMTAIVHARAPGVPPFDQPRIKEILANLKNVPCMRVDSKALETEVMQKPDVDDAELTRNIFGNALLLVRYRTPVAELADVHGMALSKEGTLYQASDLPDDLPKIKMPQGGPPTLIGVAGSWEPLSLSALAVYARQNYPKTNVVIEVNESGVVCLNIDSGRVILGSFDDLDLKLKALETLLQKNPQELSEVQEVNLTLPSAPAVVPKDKE